MAFKQNLWTDGKSQYPGRRSIEVNGETKFVRIERDEGIVTTEGDEFNAANMNNLEERIAQAFAELYQQLGNANLIETYYPVGKIFMSLVNFRLEEKNHTIFPNTTWVRLQDNRILLPADVADQVNDAVTERSYTFPGTAVITTPSSKFVGSTTLTKEHLPAHQHSYVDHSFPESEIWTVHDNKCAFGSSYSFRFVSNSGHAKDVKTTQAEGTNSVSHTHPASASAKFYATAMKNKLQTVQRCIKVYVWRRTK